MCKPVYLHYKFDINVDIWVILLTRTKWQDWWKVVHSNFYIKCFHCQTLMYKLKCFFFFFKHALTDSFTHHTHSQQKWMGESLVIKNPSIFNPVLVTDLQSGWVRASTGVGEVKKKKKKDWLKGRGTNDCFITPWSLKYTLQYLSEEFNCDSASFVSEN